MMRRWRRRSRTATPRRRGGVLVAAALLAVAASAQRAAGGRLTDFTQAEFLTLPRLCLAQRFINEELTSPVVPDAERAEIEKTLGHSYIHYHHYCWALLLVARAQRPGGDTYDYVRAIDNFDYVIRNADPRFALMAEVHVQRGDVLERTAKGTDAEVAYRTAIRTNPDYIAAYVALAEHYLSAGDVPAARRTLAQGLARDPTSQPLLDRQKALAQHR